MIGAFLASRVGRYLMVGAAVLVLTLLVLWYVFNAGSKTGRAAAMEAVHAGTEALKQRVREAKKPRSEDEVLDDLDSGRF